jgi:photosystem II stability/assembly factor-like uncharacterized protein
MQTNGPLGSGGPAYSVCTMDSAVIVGTWNRMYVSTDQGIRWRDITPEHASTGDASPLSLSVDGQTLYTGIRRFGVFVSTNLGESWSHYTINPTSSFTEAGGSGDWILAGSPTGAGYQSTDRGITWNPLPIQTSVSVVSVLDSLGLIGNLSGILRSTNMGATWNNVRPTAREVKSLVRSGNHVIAGVENTILMSTDAGHSWSSDSANLDCQYINALLFDSTWSNNVIAGTDAGVFLSSDGGATWRQPLSRLTSLPVFSLASQNVGGGATLYAATSEGVFRSTDSGESWNATRALDGTWKLASFGQSLLAGAVHPVFNGKTKYTSSSGFQRRNYIYRSDDLGVHWRECDTAVSDKSNWILSSLAMHPVSAGPARLFAGMTSNFKEGLGALFASSDDGTTWSRVFTDSGTGSLPTVVSSSPNIFLGLSPGGIVRSTDGGDTWLPSDAGVSTPPYDQVPLPAAINAFSIDGDKMYAAGSAEYVVLIPPGTLAQLLVNYVFVSSNGGDGWQRVDSGFTPVTYVEFDKGSLLTSIYAAGSHLVVGTRRWDPALPLLPPVSGGIYHIVDNGAGWVLADSSLGGRQVYALTGSGHDVIAGTDAGVFHSSDYGSTWKDISEGMADSNVSALTIAEGSLFAATASGVWKRPFAELTSVDNNAIKGQVPDGIRLEQNFPNPFNPRTVISYQLSAVSKTKIAVYDVLGREIVVLVNELKDPGRHNVLWNANMCASGIYFCRLEAGGFSDSKKMFLVK